MPLILLSSLNLPFIIHFLWEIALKNKQIKEQILWKLYRTLEKKDSLKAFLFYFTSTANEFHVEILISVNIIEFTVI